MGPVGSRCGRPASRGGRVRPGLAGNGEVAARARAPQARVRARRRRPPSQGGHGFSGPHHWNGFSGPRCWRRASRPAPGQARPSATPRACAARPPCTRAAPGALAARPGPHPTRENGTYSSRERYLLAVRTVLVGRENGSYNVDRARTWLRGSGRLLVAWGLTPHRLALCRYVGCLLVVWVGAGVRPSGSASLSGCPLVVRGWGRRLLGGRPWWLPVVCSSGAWVAVLHIHPGVLVGMVASFQRFPAPRGGGEQDECATRAPLHIHPGSQAQADGRIRMIPPFTDRGL